MNQGLNTTDDVFGKVPKAKPVVDVVNEEEALARAKEEGIEFVDTFYLSEGISLTGKEEPYATRKEAEQANKKAGGKLNVIQKRERKS